MNTRTRLVGIVCGAAIALTGCTGDDNGGEKTTAPADDVTTAAPTAPAIGCPTEDPVPGAVVLATRGTDDFAFEIDDDVVEVGDVFVTFRNTGVTDHSLFIEGTDLGMLATPDAECRANIQLQPGTWTIFCDVVGHREAGMESTFTVT